MLLSIIIPEYKQNRNYLFNCIDSINNQLNVDFEEIEVLIIEDGGDEIDFNRFSFPNIKNIHWIASRNHLGCGEVRNYGLNNAIGEWIWFVDSDDYLPFDTSLEYVIDSIKNTKSDLPYFAMYHNLPNGNFELKNVLYTGVYTKLFKKEIIDRYSIRFVKSNAYEDWCFFECYMALVNYNIEECFKVPVYVYRYNSNSVTQSTPDYLCKAIMGDLENIMYREYILGKNNIPMQKNYIMYDIFRLAKQYCRLLTLGYENEEPIVLANKHFENIRRMNFEFTNEEIKTVANSFKCTYDMKDKYNFNSLFTVDNFHMILKNGIGCIKVENL